VIVFISHLCFSIFFGISFCVSVCLSICLSHVYVVVAVAIVELENVESRLPVLGKLWEVDVHHTNLICHKSGGKITIPNYLIENITFATGLEKGEWDYDDRPEGEPPLEDNAHIPDRNDVINITDAILRDGCVEGEEEEEEEDEKVGSENNHHHQHDHHNEDNMEEEDDEEDDDSQ